MKKIIFLVIIVTLCMLLILFPFNFSTYFSGNVELIDDIISQEVSKVQNGDYLFLMVPSPNSGESTSDLNELSSFIVHTDLNNSIKEIIEISGFYDDMDLVNKFIYLFSSYNDSVLKANFLNNSYDRFDNYDDFVEDSSDIYISLGTNSITLTSNYQVIELNDPYIKYQNQTFYVVDFVQLVTKL